MKTKTFFLLCLLLGMALTQLSAQNSNSYQTGTINVMSYGGGGYHMPIYCDGEYVDEWRAVGPYEIRNLFHYKDTEMNPANWDWQWFQGRFKDLVFASDKTGEVFRMHGIEKGGSHGPTDDYIYEVKVNMQGSMGSHYILHFSILVSTLEIIDYDSNCHEN